MPVDQVATGEETSAAQTRPTSWLTVEVVADAGDWSPFQPVDDHIAKAMAALARHPRFADYGLSEAVIALSDDASVRNLNVTYRNKDKPTNVLSFPSGAAPRGGVITLGDVVLAAETIAGEAAAQGIEPTQHLQHLVVHGLLHLLGFDHETDEEANEMEEIEADVLAALGIPNPYAETAP